MKVQKNLVIAVVLFLILLVIGSIVYHKVEGWDYLNSLYFVVMTVTTVGYGDFVPKTNIGKIFTMFFSFMGIVFVFYFISVIGSALFKKHLGKKISEVKEGVKKDVSKDVKQDVRRNVQRDVQRNVQKVVKKSAQKRTKSMQKTRKR